MNIIINFLIEHYILLIMLVGMFMMTLFDVYLDRSMIYKLRTVFGLILLLAVFDHLETYTGNLDHFTSWRIVLSFLCYSLRPTIILMLIFIVSPKINKLIIIPAVINMLISATAFFSGIAYSFDTVTNSFIRGPLGYTPYIMTLLYILTLYYITIRVLIGRFTEEGIVILFIALTATFSAVLSYMAHDEVVEPTYAACVMLYYMYMYAQYTKKDPLTSLFNRQTFQSDMKKHSGTISGIISIDLNDLKWMNDNNGHKAGDTALITVSRCFCEITGDKERVYRIGGDEFVIISRKRSVEEMEDLVKRLKKGVDDTGYSCAFGLSYGKTPDEMLLESDDNMYKEKMRIKKELEEKGIIRVRT